MVTLFNGPNLIDMKKQCNPNDNLTVFHFKIFCSSNTIASNIKGVKYIEIMLTIIQKETSAKRIHPKASDIISIQEVRSKPNLIKSVVLTNGSICNETELSCNFERVFSS